MDNIEDFQEKHDEYGDLKEAIQKTINKLKEYYIMTDNSVYTIATSMFKIIFLIFLIFLIFNN
jgi:hypothetical protein